MSNRGLFALSIFCCSIAAAQDQGRLLATSGLLSLDGSAGGGLTSWAVLSGYGSEDSYGIAVQAAHANFDDYDLDTLAFSLSIKNRVEVFAARQRLTLPQLLRNAGLPPSLSQQTFGAKVRLYGDLVYGKGPQISATITHKQHQDEGALIALGIPRHDDTELQVAATKLWVNGPGNRFWLLHGGLRYSRAAQLGFLGYGDTSTDRKWTAEAALAFFPTRELAIGTEYRQMPDIIPGIPEDDWKDIFVAWFPNKHINITGAWVDTGNVAGVGDQDGWYLSLQGSW